MKYTVYVYDDFIDLWIRQCSFDTAEEADDFCNYLSVEEFIDSDNICYKECV